MPDYRLAADRAAERHGINKRIFRAMIQQESGFRPGARSPAGASGIAQFMPATAKAYGVNLSDRRVSDDLDGAARYLKANLKRTGGNYTQALSIYNSGRPDGFKHISETANYVRTILGNAGTQGSSGGSMRLAPPATRNITRTVTPAVDNSAIRAGLVTQFLGRRDQDPLDFALGIRGAQDVPAVTKTVREPIRQASGARQSASVRGKSPLLELFWQGPGGINVKNGQKVAQGFVSGHEDHVHVGAGPKTIVELGKLAQSMGLHVGENPHFGKVNPVHVQNSLHYRNEAIDVSGDPARMRAYARRVARMYGIR
jgi:hypothetical protein